MYFKEQDYVLRTILRTVKKRLNDWEIQGKYSYYGELPENPVNTYEPATTETLQLSYLSMSHTSDAKLTNHGNCAAN